MTGEATMSRLKNEHKEWAHPQVPPVVKKRGQMGFWRLPPLPHNRLVHLSVCAYLTQTFS